MSNTALMERKERMVRTLLHPLTHHGYGFWMLLVVLFFTIGTGAMAWSLQLRHGLEVTGLTDHIPWGFYIINFVMFIGISHAGTFISAVLRLSGATWRKPIVRMAEFMTISALTVGALMPLMDIGRPDRLWHILVYGRLESPILWDILAVTSYLTGSLIYLYLPLIPDIATCRDRLRGKVGPIRQFIYDKLSLGWQGTPEQHERLDRGMRIMAVLIIGVMITVHTVVSWLFGMTLRVGWNSTIFGPYFVIGAIYSGVAAVITGMYVFRRVYRLQEYLTPKHFEYLGNILLASGLVYFYFTFAEYWTLAYKLSPPYEMLLSSLLVGPYAWHFWFFIIGGTLIPCLMLALPWTRTMAGITVASILINIGMWIKRYFIIVPSLAVPQTGTTWAIYSPTWVETAIVVASFAGFILVITLLSKVFPLIPMWEVFEDMDAEAAGTQPAQPQPEISHPQPSWGTGGDAPELGSRQ